MDTKRKKILFLFNRSPFLYEKRNDRHQFQIYSELKDHYETKILTFENDFDNSFEQIAIKRDNNKYLKILYFLLKAQSPRLTHFRSKKFDYTLSKLLESFKPDFIYVEHLLMMQYVVDKNLSGKIVFFNDESNLFIESKKIRGNFYQRLRNIGLSKFEIVACNKADYIFNITKDEKEFLENVYGYRNTFTIPCGVDTNYFIFNWEPTKPKSILFIGDYDHYPNRAAVKILVSKIFPQINRDDVKLILVGRNTHRIHKYSKQGIEIFTDVNDIRKFYRSSSIFVAPIFSGAGMRIKILEAASCGIPIVMTSIGNFGINLRNKDEVFIEDTVDCIIKRVKYLMNQQGLEKTEKMRKLARDRIVKNFNEKLIKQHIKDEFKKLDGK